MRDPIFIALHLAAIGLPAVSDTVPAWRNAIEKDAAIDLVNDYTSNVIRVEWAGDKVKKMAWAMPANLTFQLAVCGDADVTNRVRAILEATRDALPEETRAYLERRRFLVPTLQWLVRSVRAQKLGYGFFDIRSQPCVFVESDFDRTALTNAASTLKPKFIPPCAMVELVYNDGRLEILRPLPGVDYPDIMSEETYSVKFGCAYVVRAPEAIRRIRVRATTYPFQVRNMEFAWGIAQRKSLNDWRCGGEAYSLRGKAEIEFNLGALNSGCRADIMVYPRFKNGAYIYGLPAIISFYKPPASVWTLDAKGRTESIAYYADTQHQAIYDISPIWTPRQWTDYYDWDTQGLLSRISRMFPGHFKRVEYARCNEWLLSEFSSGTPEEVKEMKYAIDPETGRLKCEEMDCAPKKYRLGEFQPRNRFER